MDGESVAELGGCVKCFLKSTHQEPVLCFSTSLLILNGHAVMCMTYFNICDKNVVFTKLIKTIFNFLNLN